MTHRVHTWLPAVFAAWVIVLGVMLWDGEAAKAVSLEGSAAAGTGQTGAHALAGLPQRRHDLSLPVLVGGRGKRIAGSASPAPSSAQAAQGYAGQDTCLVCHADKAYASTSHGRMADPRTPAATLGCESCHGPGRAHAEAGGDTALIRSIKTLPARERSETCTTCHNRGEHAMWEGSPHEARQVACTACHSVHEPKSPDGQLVTLTELETCASCHRDKLSKLDRSGHMPVREGKLQCTTCHNPHGSANVRMLRVGTVVNEACTSCHADKRGPFLWEHAPVRENCTTCHDPHGSSNERMLVAKLPMLCQRCHAHTRHPATIYDNAVVRTSNRLYARSCVTCHANIHGSNHASGTTFLR